MRTWAGRLADDKLVSSGGATGNWVIESNGEPANPFYFSQGAKCTCAFVSY